MPERRHSTASWRVAWSCVRGWRNVQLEDEVRRAVRRRVADISGARPVVEVLLLRRER